MPKGSWDGQGKVRKAKESFDGAKRPLSVQGKGYYYWRHVSRGIFQLAPKVETFAGSNEKKGICEGNVLASK